MSTLICPTYGCSLVRLGVSKDKATVYRFAARNLASRTLYGEFRLHPDTGRQVGHRILTVQWQRGRRRAIWPPDRAETALRYPLERVKRRV